MSDLSPTPSRRKTQISYNSPTFKNSLRRASEVAGRKTDLNLILLATILTSIYGKVRYVDTYVSVCREEIIIQKERKRERERERVPHRRFRKWYATYYQAHQALHLPPITYHLINFITMNSENKRSCGRLLN